MYVPGECVHVRASVCVCQVVINKDRNIGFPAALDVPTRDFSTRPNTQTRTQTHTHTHTHTVEIKTNLFQPSAPRLNFPTAS